MLTATDTTYGQIIWQAEIGICWLYSIQTSICTKIPPINSFIYKFISLTNLVSVHTLKSVVTNFPLQKREKIVAGVGEFCACSLVSNLITFKGIFFLEQEHATYHLHNNPYMGNDWNNKPPFPVCRDILHF